MTLTDEERARGPHPVMELPGVYIAALRVDEIFADPSYQRVLDVARARRMCTEWDPRLAGILEVSDRGEQVGSVGAARYAVVDGQHRWAAAGFFVHPPPVVANVHTGLTLADEAELFDKLNRQRKGTNTWDHWRARRIAGEQAVLDIEGVVTRNGLDVHMSPLDGKISCVSTLEKVVKLGGLDLLHQTLSLIVEVWGDRREALDAPIIHGLALILWYLHVPIDLTRVGDAMLTVNPRQLKANANQLKEITSGNGAVRTAIAVMALYNKTPGRRLLVSNRTFTGKRREAGDA